MSAKSFDACHWLRGSCGRGRPTSGEPERSSQGEDKYCITCKKKAAYKMQALSIIEVVGIYIIIKGSITLRGFPKISYMDTVIHFSIILSARRQCIIAAYHPIDWWVLG
jgi:hypothetical protein